MKHLDWLFVVFYCISCTCLWSSVQGYRYVWLTVDDRDIGDTVHLVNGDSLTLTCHYSSEIGPPTLIVNNTMILTVYTDREDRTVAYNVPEVYRLGQSLYRCEGAIGYDEVTVIYSSTPPPTTPTSPITHTASTSTDPGSNFTGLNPLIYTISAVILLGSLAIVAIITCWIRARRSFNNRSLRSAQTAQDYFDYLSDNEFTPLTSEEFQASLQERPPTYNQSEQIESQGQTEETTPPPSPPPERNIPPEEAAIIENLIALNLLPEDSRPSRREQRRQSPRMRRVQVETTPTVHETTPIVHETTPPAEDTAVEQLRNVGARAQQLLQEQRSTGQLVSLDTNSQ